MNTQDNSKTGVSVHKGFPNPATDNTLASLDINQLLVKHPASTFFMRISGSEWEDIGIYERDVAIVDRALAPKKHSLVIWWEDSIFRISKLNKVPEDKQVWGVVSSIIHRFTP